MTSLRPSRSDDATDRWRAAYPRLPSPADLGLPEPHAVGGRRSGAALPKMGAFRFQLLADWITMTFPPCRVADIGGGKGLLTYLLCRAGFDAVVVDPVRQDLPTKYTDLHTGRRLRLGVADQVPRWSVPFTSALAAERDLLVGLHAHASNLLAIDAAAEHGTGFVLLPCCLIGEPLVPVLGVSWFTQVAAYATARGFSVGYFQLNFRGQHLGLYAHALSGDPSGPEPAPRAIPRATPHAIPRSGTRIG